MSHQESKLAQFCSEYGLYSGKEGHFTHISMNGYKSGRINVPMAKLSEFLDVMVHDLQTNAKKHCLSERITSTDEEFRCFFDLDFLDEIPAAPRTSTTSKSTSHDGSTCNPVGEEVEGGAPSQELDEESLAEAMKPYSDEKMRAIVGVMVRAMRRFYPDDFDETKLVTIVARAPVAMANNNRVKHAFHIHQPGHIVNIDRVMQFRKAIIEAFRKEFGARRPNKEGNPWEDVVDKNVYGYKQGLRMIFNCKYGKCATCKGKGQDNNGERCNICIGDKYRNLGREYTPSMAINYDGTDNEYLITKKRILACDNTDSLKSALIYCSFRRSNEINEPMLRSWVLPANFEPYEGAPRILVSEVNGKKGNVINGKLPASARVPIDPDGEVAQLALEAVRSIAPQYANLTIAKFSRTEKSGKCFMKVRGDGQHYCMNIKHEHNSNTVYFVFTPRGVSQKCFSPSEELKYDAQRLCKHFESKLFPISRTLERYLFTDAKSVSKVDFRYGRDEVDDDGGNDVDPHAIKMCKRRRISTENGRSSANVDADIDVGADVVADYAQDDAELPPKKKKKWDEDSDDDIDEDYMATVYACNVNGFANLEKFVKGSASNLEPAISQHHGGPQRFQKRNF